MEVTDISAPAGHMTTIIEQFVDCDDYVFTIGLLNQYVLLLYLVFVFSVQRWFSVILQTYGKYQQFMYLH